MSGNKNQSHKFSQGFTPTPQHKVFGVSSDTKSERGFTLIELLVVIAIIALLASILLVALQSAQIKSRNVKRLSDMAQMNTALEMYFNTNKGYPSSVNGIPASLSPDFASSIPQSPQPPDAVCDGVNHSGITDVNGNPVLANTYYYQALGTPYLNGSGGTSVYPSYTYLFCLGNQTGNFSAGERILTPGGVR